MNKKEADKLIEVVKKASFETGFKKASEQYKDLRHKLIKIKKILEDLK